MEPTATCVRVPCSVFRVQGAVPFSACRVQDSALRLKTAGSRIQHSISRVLGPRYRIQGFGVMVYPDLSVQDSGIWIPGLGAWREW